LITGMHAPSQCQHDDRTPTAGAHSAGKTETELGIRPHSRKLAENKHDLKAIAFYQ
jgi:hypothetical protein